MTTSNDYSRSNPSKEYLGLIKQYQKLHEFGDPSRGVTPENQFPGNSLPVHAEPIKKLIDQTGASTLIDYGCGKGLQYKWTDIKLKSGAQVPSLKEYWAIQKITCYDPAVPKFMALPEGQFDGVISTDVLEHCPPEDIDWILNEIFSFAKKFVFMNIACHKAKAILPDGQNAHRTAMPPSWWIPKIEQLAKKFPGVKYHVVLERKVSFLFLKHRFRTIVKSK